MKRRKERKFCVFLLSRLCSLNTVIYSFVVFVVVVVYCLHFSLRWREMNKKEGRKVARPMSSSCSLPFSKKQNKKKCRVQARMRVKSKHIHAQK